MVCATRPTSARASSSPSSAPHAAPDHPEHGGLAEHQRQHLAAGGAERAQHAEDGRRCTTAKLIAP